MKFSTTLCALLYTGYAFAQTESPDSTYLLDEFVISANKIPELRSKLSQQVFIISGSRIGELNLQTTADLLGNSGAVAVQKSQQGGGSAQLRGFEASRVLLVVDGIRMNNLIYRSGHLQNMITLDNNALQRVEILSGPSSTVYGSDALGGVIHFTTIDPVLDPDDGHIVKANAFFRYGTVNQEKTTHADVNYGGIRFGSFSSFTYSDFSDLKMGRRTNPALGEPFGLRHRFIQRSQDNSMDLILSNSDPYTQKFSGYSQYDLLQKFLFCPASGIRHSLNLQYSSSSNIPRYDRLTDQAGAELRFAEWYYGPQQRFMVAYHLKVEKPFKIADVFQTTLSYQHIKESRHDRRFNRTDRSNQFEKVDVLAFTADFQKVLVTHDLRFGLDVQLSGVHSEAFYENVLNGARSPAATRYPDGKNRMHSYAFYVTHSHDITDKLTVNDGVRIGLSALKAVFETKTFFPFPFDEVEQNNSFASGNLGLVFRPKEQWRFSFLASTGYRVPNIDDVAKVFDTHAGESLIVPNPDIKPEKTVNLDLGISAHFSDKLHWENTLFYTFFFDAIVLDAFLFNGQSEIDFEGQPTRVLANQNKRRAYITGVTSLLHSDLSSSFSANASFTYTRGRIRKAESETPLDHIPPSFGRASLQYRKKQFTGEVFVNFSGWKRIDDYFLDSEDNEMYAPAEGMPSWITMNIRTSFALNSHFLLQAGVDNIFDLQYRTFSSGINAAGRNILGTLRISF